MHVRREIAAFFMAVFAVNRVAFSFPVCVAALESLPVNRVLRTFATICLVWCACLSSLVHARESLPSAIPGWMVDHWDMSDGLPMQEVNDVATDADGFVWLATFDGLVRFDGQSFTVLRAADPDGPPSTRVRYVARHPQDGALWLLTEARQLQRRTKDSITTWPLETHRIVHGFALGSEAIWVLSDTGILRLDDVPHEVTPPLLDGLDGSFLFVNAGAQVVLLTTAGAFVRPESDGPWTLLPPHSVGSGDLVGRDLSTGWVLTTRGTALVALDPTTGVLWPTPSLAGMPVNTPPEPMSGLDVLRPVLAAAALSKPNGFAGLNPQGPPYWSIFSPTGGITRLRPVPVSTWRPPTEGAHNISRVWWDDATQTLHAQEYNTQWWPAWSPPGVAPTALPLPADVSCTPWTLRYHRDAAHTLWLACENHVLRLQGDAWQADAPPERNRSGPFWNTRRGMVLGGTDSSLAVYHDGVWQMIRSVDGPLNDVFALAELSDGGWLVGGTFGARWVRAGSAVAEGLLLLPDGRPLGAVRHAETRHGWVWLSTVDRGVCVWTPTQADVVRCLDSTRLGGRGTVHASIDDHLGRTWVSTNQGLGVFSTTRLVDWANGGPAPSPLWLGTAHGMASAEGNGFLSDAVARAPDNRLWFATQEGAAIVDPAQLSLPVAPNVVVTQLFVGTQPYSPTARLTLPRAHAPVELSWTAPVADFAEQVVYRYRIAPDGQWSAPQQSKSLSLPSLPPGDSTLVLQARLGDEWGEETHLSMYRTPAFSERSTFPLLLLLGLTATLGAAASVRGRWLARNNARLAELVRAQTIELADQNEALNDLNQTLASQNTMLAQRAAHIAAQARQLSELDSLKRQLIANVSHELRTPLSLIVGPLGTLRTRTHDADVQRVLGTAIQNAHRLDTIISQLFDLSKAQAGGARLRARRLDLAKLCEDIVQRFDLPAEEAGVSLVLTADSRPVWIWGERDRLDKVLTNLISNALRYSPIESRVCIHIAVAETQVTVGVADTGPGVPETQKANVFARFFQVEGRPGGGAGLGLALAQELVELHGGQIGVRDTLSDTAHNPGAHFWFTLPRGAAHLAPEEVDLSPVPRAQIAAEVWESTGDDGNQTVLIVEDHHDLRAYLAEVLGERFCVVTAAHGGIALSILDERDDIDIIVSDIMMPEVDGMEMARALRGSARHRNLPLLFVSARQEVEDRVEGLALADDYLPKPFSAPELTARVAALLRRAHAPPGADAQPSEPLPERSALEARLREVTDARIADATFTAGPLAKAMAMSPRTLQLKMQAEGLPTPTEWLRAYRISFARKLMEDGTHRSVGELAASVGMSRNYFGRMYRGFTGRTPGEDLDE